MLKQRGDGDLCVCVQLKHKATYGELGAGANSGRWAYREGTSSRDDCESVMRETVRKRNVCVCVCVRVCVRVCVKRRKVLTPSWMQVWSSSPVWQWAERWGGRCTRPPPPVCSCSPHPGSGWTFHGSSWPAAQKKHKHRLLLVVTPKWKSHFLFLASARLIKNPFTLQARWDIIQPPLRPDKL